MKTFLPPFNWNDVPLDGDGDGDGAGMREWAQEWKWKWRVGKRRGVVKEEGWKRGRSAGKAGSELRESGK